MSHLSKNWTIDKQREANRKSYHKHKDKRNKKVKERQGEIRRIVINNYGGKCKCCGETIIEFLAIDHINGGGYKHRQIIGNSIRYYYWIIRNNFPDNYRILCHNCNQATSWGRKCPHELMEA